MYFNISLTVHTSVCGPITQNNNPHMCTVHNFSMWQSRSQPIIR